MGGSPASPLFGHVFAVVEQDPLVLFILNSESFGVGPPCLVDALLECYSFIFQFPGLCGPYCISFKVRLSAVLGTGVQVVDLRFIPSACLWELPSSGIITVANGVCRAMRY